MGNIKLLLHGGLPQSGQSSEVRDITQNIYDHVEHFRDEGSVSRTKNDNMPRSEYKRGGYFLRFFEQ